MRTTDARTLRTLFLLFALVMISSLASIGGSIETSAAVAATDLPDFILYPEGQETSYFAISIEPGESQTLTVHLGNAGGEQVEARTYATDAYTLINGGFGNRSEETGKTGATTWLDYESETLMLEPNVLVDRTFSVSVPKETKPGQYLSAIVLQTAEPIKISGSDMFQQIILKSIAVFITVPGPVAPSFNLGEATVNVTAGAYVLNVALHNDGNVLVKPAGTLTVSNSRGEIVVTYPVAMGSVYAGTGTTLEVALSGAMSPGDYTVNVALEDAATGATAHVEALPITLIDPTADGQAQSPVVIKTIGIEPSTDTATGLLRFVGVNIQVENTGEPLTAARMTLRVTRDGELVENFVLAASLALPNGMTTVEQRYLPSDSWVPGLYEFTVTLEEVGASGQSTVLAEATAGAAIEVSE